MNYYNTLDVLANRYPDVELPNVPAHQRAGSGLGAPTSPPSPRTTWRCLEQNAAIKEQFLSEPDWLNLDGLPISYEEREVNGESAGPADAADAADGIRDLERAGARNRRRSGEPAKRAGQGEEAQQRHHSGRGEGPDRGRRGACVYFAFAHARRDRSADAYPHAHAHD